MFDVTVTGLEKTKRLMDRLTGPQLVQAQAEALNDVAFMVRRAMQSEIGTAFDDPTPYIKRSPLVRKATPEKLYARIEPTYDGKKGVDPQKILRAETFGGRRHDKRSEVALRAAGILPAGYQIVIPSEPYPGSADRYGNLKGSFLTQLISYFRAFGEVGYRANMTDRRKASIHRGKEISGPLRSGEARMSTGRRYFVSFGRLRGGRSSHLEPGIWAASGPGGVGVRPVAIFVKAGVYRPRLSTDRIARNADINNALPRRMRYRMRLALERGLK